MLLDEQQVAFEAVRGAVADASGNGGGRKKVVLVRGGPGTGKSAIALNLYAAMARSRVKVVHATGSKAMTETLRLSVFGENHWQGEDVFKYFNNFARARQNELDVLICDEAHRLRGQANVPDYWRGRLRGQIHQLIDAAKVPVFLLDDHQVVRPSEIGSPNDVLEIARAMDCQIVEVDLDGQFRCGGSPLFDLWVQRLLGLVEEAPVSWSDLVADTDDEYVVESVEAPHALESWLRARIRDTDLRRPDRHAASAGSGRRRCGRTESSAWPTTSGSVAGTGRGTRGRMWKSRTYQPHRSGRRTRGASARSAVSTRPRVSNTTGPA